MRRVEFWRALLVVLAVLGRAAGAADETPGERPLSVRARKALRTLGAVSLEDLAQRFTPADLRRTGRIDLEVRREISGALKSRGLSLRQVGETEETRPAESEGPSGEARVILKQLGVEDLADLAGRFTARALLAGVGHREGGPHREIIEYAATKGHPLTAGLEELSLSPAEALAKLRKKRYLLEMTGASRIEDLPRHLSILEYAERADFGHRRAFQLAALFEAAKIPLSTTATERKRRFSRVDEVCRGSLESAEK